MFTIIATFEGSSTNCEIGSGVWQMEWELKSGDYLVVSFNSKPIEDNESSVSEIYEINLVSYHIEIKSNDLSQ